MHVDRRIFLTGLSATLITPTSARAQSVTDSAGRAVPMPAQVTRVFPAGPPAAITLYTVAPDLLLGWPRANRADELEFLDPKIGPRPEVGRITGRGNTANLEVVLALKPDLILDIGIVNNTYISLADRVQQQTGIPYALLDGRFDGIAGTYRTIGALTGRRDAGEAAARYADETIKTITGRLPPPEKRPRVYYARGPRGLETGLGGSINVETIELLARNVAGGTRGGLATVSIEDVLVWNPEVIVTIDKDFAETVHSHADLAASRGGAGKARSPVAETAVWLGRFPAVGEPADRTMVAGKNSLSRPFSRESPHADARVLSALLSRAAKRRADRPRAGRTRLMRSA